MCCNTYSSSYGGIFSRPPKIQKTVHHHQTPDRSRQIFVHTTSKFNWWTVDEFEKKRYFAVTLFTTLIGNSIQEPAGRSCPVVSLLFLSPLLAGGVRAPILIVTPHIFYRRPTAALSHTERRSKQPDCVHSSSIGERPTYVRERPG